MQRLFYLNCLLNNIDIRLSCHQEKSESNHTLVLVNKNNEIVFNHLYNKTQSEIICVPWIIHSKKQIAAICLNPTCDWLLIITEDNSLYVVPTFRSTEKKNRIDPKWSASDVTTITDDLPCRNCKTKPLQLLWWQRKNLNQNAVIGYEDGTIRLVCLENGSCLDTSKVNDHIYSLNLCLDENWNGTSILIQGESGQKWRLTLEREFIGSIWTGRGSSRKALHFLPPQLVNEDIPEFSPFKCCIICAITEESSMSNECYTSLQELDLNVEILESHFGFSKNERVLHVYKFVDSDCFNSEDFNEARNGLQLILPSLIENIRLSKPFIRGYLAVTTIGVYKISLSFFVIDKVIDLVINNKTEFATRLAIIFGLNLTQLLESCGDLMIVHGAIYDGLKMYEYGKIDPVKKISKIAHNNEVLLNFSKIYLTTNKNTMTIKSKIYMTNLIVMAYVQIISKTDKELKQYKQYEEDFLKFILHQEFHDPNVAFEVICKFELWHVASLLAITHGFQNELVATLSQIVANSPPINDTNFVMILSEPGLTQSLLILPECCNTILRYVRKNLKNFPRGILQRFANQLDLSKQGNIFDETEDQMDHRIKIIETFILCVMQLSDQAKALPFSINTNLLQKLKPIEEIPQNQNAKKFYNFSTLSCGYKFAAVIRNDKVYTMGDSTSGALGVGPTEKQNNPPKLVHTLDALNVIALSVSCGKKHTLVLTDSGVYSWGLNAYGQLGISSLNRQSPYPAIVSSLKDEHIVAVVAGQYHSMALTASGFVYTWGWGIHGQLGHGTSNNECIPRLLTFHEQIVKIAAGYAHSLILTSQGKIYGFGSNAYGQLARENLSGNKSSIPIEIVLLCNMYIPYRDIAAGYFQNVVIRANDELLYIWGTTPKYVQGCRLKSKKNSKNKPLQRWKSPSCIYTGTTANPIKKVVVGLDHVVMLHRGKLHVCKNMENKFIKIKTNEQIISGNFSSISCGSDFTLARSYTGRLFFWGNDVMAKTLMGKSCDNANRAGSFEFNLESNPAEILGLPSIIITYYPVEHSFKFSKSVWNQAGNDVYEFEQETLIRILETYFGYYDTENIISKCLEMNNLQAASKVAILNNQFEDSFGYQLKAIESGKLLECDWKNFRNLIEFYIDCTYSSESNIYIKNIINMCIEFWINNNLPVTTFEDILLRNVDKLSNTLFNLIFCEHSNNNFQEKMNENEDDDNKLRNHKVSRFLKSFSSNLKLQLCSSIIQYYVAH